MSAAIEVRYRADWLDWTMVMRAARRFGIEHVSAGERALVEAVLTGCDAIAVLPRGGRPLCYQLPALFLPGPTLVVTPELAHLDSSLRAGHAPLLHATPERLQTDDCIAMLRTNAVARIVVEEAHRVSPRCRDFRPAYLAIAEVAWRIGRPPILAITPRATRGDLGDIVARLALHQPVVVRGDACVAGGGS